MSTVIVVVCAVMIAIVTTAAAWAMRCLRRLHRQYLAEVERDRIWDEEHKDG